MQLIINILFSLIVLFILYRLIFNKDTIIVIEIDRNKAFTFNWGKHSRGFAFMFIGVHMLDCNLPVYMEICKKTVDDRNKL